MLYLTCLQSEGGTKAFNDLVIPGMHGQHLRSEMSQGRWAVNPQAGPYPVSPSVPVLPQVGLWASALSLFPHSSSCNNRPDLCTAQKPFCLGSCPLPIKTHRVGCSFTEGSLGAQDSQLGDGQARTKPHVTHALGLCFFCEESQKQR